MQQRVHQIYPTMTFTIGLSRMIASLEKLNTPVRSINAAAPAPTILVSTVPAIVLLVDGKPVLAPIQGSSLQYVVNTNWDLFYDQSAYYLLSGKTWLRATQLSGPWTATTKLPPEMVKLPPHENWDDVLKAVPAVPGTAPKVMFTEKPAELIAFKGSPVSRRFLEPVSPMQRTQRAMSSCTSLITKSTFCSRDDGSGPRTLRAHGIMRAVFCLPTSR